MTGSLSNAGIKRDILALVAFIPQGRLATHGAIGRHLGVERRHVANVLIALTDAERASLPWWRVVADGGAIGRHRWRDEQMAKLKTEGVPVAPAGIVRELTERAVRDLNANSAFASTLANATHATGNTIAHSLSRGTKSHS